MSRAAQFSVHGPGRWGLRLRGVVVIVVVALILVLAWRVTQPDRSGQIQFSVEAADLGDGVSTDTTVRLRGMSIGSVVGVQARGPHRQRVTVSVDADPLRELSTSMNTRFVSSNLFGSTAFELIPMPGGRPIRPNAVLQLGDVGDYTVTTVMRNSGRLLLDVVTDQLSTSIDNAAQLTEEMAPMLASALLVVRASARARDMSLSELLPHLADVSEGMAAFTPSALSILHSLAAVEELDDDFRARQASATITEVSNLVMALSGQVVGALGSTSETVDMLLDLLIPLNRSLKNVTPEQVSRLIGGLDGALHREGDKVVLGVDALVRTFPAFRVPLDATGGGAR
ncbi:MULTISPECIES: MlaD family protein [Nocardia]|uniref:MlaD family protein n=1 Tax=Nocardia TaxID=1817 RepID=UPI0007EB8B86|nr:MULTISPECIES: MlaD family protein [Nocardia]MBF6277447.1 Mce family protein [Nocardia nova]OBA43902.1 Mce family protein [Nocardia sp. 852002-51101_SCH5132738]OBB48027.1 Mce family protein [Nocardia sp. 852002-51244_SCH5132740]OBF71705.1 Mce family protein [Mycobacterium sp. 852002-51759_SCH5129042]